MPIEQEPRPDEEDGRGLDLVENAQVMHRRPQTLQPRRGRLLREPDRDAAFEPTTACLMLCVRSP
jgi:hypothetical protein